MSETQDRNVERTGDRDAIWSAIAREPKERYLGAMDIDVPSLPVQYWCTICCLPIFLAEVTRETGFKATRWTVTLATRIGCNPYLIRHGDDWVTVQRLYGSGEVSPKYTVSEFHDWVRRVYLEHLRALHHAGPLS